MNLIELHNTGSTPLKNIHDFLQNGDEKIKYTPNKDIVLLLGNTGSGKSTLTQYISGNAHMLLSQEVEEDTGEYVIVDKNNKISSTSTIVSQTIYPDLVEDAKTNTLYYDCPGFSDTRSAAHEIAATYFIKKVIDSARAVKMVFVVNHHSVTKGADRQDLILMLQHAADFITQMEKFKNSIALVVTKIENRYVDHKLVPDEKVIKAIDHYFEQAQRDIYQHPEMVIPEIKHKVLHLLDIFRSKEANGQNTRIGIFRKPNMAGLLSKIELMKEGKKSIENMINKNILFVEGGDNDFGYTISAKSKVYITGLSEEINKTIVKNLFNIGKEVEEYCRAQEEKNSDLECLNDIFQNLHESFLKILDNAIKDTTTPKMFITGIVNNIKLFKIKISDVYIKTVQREEDYINFLNLVSNESIKNHKASLLAAGLSNLTAHLSDFHSFYSFLHSIYQRLSEFEIQKKRDKYCTIHVNELNDLFQSPVFEEIETIFKQHSSIMEIKLDERKLIFLKRVLDDTLKYQIEVNTSEIDKIVVKGVNVMLSDLNEELIKCKNDIKFIEVYALHKVFIDTSLDLTGREIQMAIVAPEWEILGSQSIILDGKPGIDYNPKKANCGEWNTSMNRSEKGLDGQPGEPGGPAGNFIGIGKHFRNERCLHISANGGKGGRGQDGGDGAEGSSRWYPYWVDKSGGDGGDGGIGGYGGPKGYIYTKKLGTELGTVETKQTALDGCIGENGSGGNGGRGGRHSVWLFIGIIPYINSWAENGCKGASGRNECGRKNPWQLKTKLIDLANIKTEYKTYLQNNISNNLQETLLKTFLKEYYNNDDTSITQAMEWS